MLVLLHIDYAVYSSLILSRSHYMLSTPELISNCMNHNAVSPILEVLDIASRLSKSIRRTGLFCIEANFVLVDYLKNMLPLLSPAWF